MPKLVVTTRAAQVHAVEAQAGMSLMEVIRESGIDELLALCGGCCACATCHIYVEASSCETLPPITDDEDDLLDASSHRTDSSRLSCQIEMSDSLDGLRVTIAPED